MLNYFAGSLVITTLSLSACNSAKPQRYDVDRADRSATTSESEAKKKAEELILDTSKLVAAPGAYDVEINYSAGTSAASLIGKETINPNSNKTVLKVNPGDSTQAGLLTVSISQNGTPKFIAKRSNTAFVPGVAVVIDDCLILPAPWTGGLNEGSCEWTIEDVAN